MAPHITEGFFIGLVLVTATLTVGSILNGVIRSRRERRIAELRAEVQGKLLDRFATSSEALEFLRSEVGAEFASATTFERSNPLSRMLGSLQIGIVSIFVGLGLFFVQSGAKPEVQEPFFVLSMLAMSLGFGFVASSLLGIYLSRRLEENVKGVPAALRRAESDS
ncbi:MAG: hypothetical protein DWQ36_24675 [Acidobacteria bacterium]|nr:MAG: hypothetical protein DWQ30_16985 [Acidobacteriota bacterium]REJ99653.1 MAG: hypothetical protein DWQ36_24675 [Acidobacteriota bacterium]